jgi:hypothetical protein
MKRVLTLAILVHWMMFFLLHALGAAAGTLDAGISGIFSSISLFEANGPMRAMPLIGAGMGLACLLAGLLFAWAVMVTLFQNEDADDNELDVERMSFASASLMFSALMLISIVRADPDMLTASCIYFGALLLSWIVASVEWELLSARALIQKETETVRVARFMAGQAAWHSNLNRISGRKGTD